MSSKAAFSWLDWLEHSIDHLITYPETSSFAAFKTNSTAQCYCDTMLLNIGLATVRRCE
jgi:hypothetical protein